MEVSAGSLIYRNEADGPQDDPMFNAAQGHVFRILEAVSGSVIAQVVAGPHSPLIGQELGFPKSRIDEQYFTFIQ